MAMMTNKTTREGCLNRFSQFESAIEKRKKKTKKTIVFVFADFVFVVVFSNEERLGWLEL